MSRKRLVSAVVALALGGALLGTGVPAGVAQTSGCFDPNYCPQETPTADGTGAGGALTKAQLRKRCIAKAQTKFGDNKPKLKAAVKKCKKKYR